MYVIPAARGRGAARRLLRALEQAAAKLGYTVARLVTGPRQPAAQHLYESEGYVAIENFHGTRSRASSARSACPTRGYRIPISELSPTMNR